MTIIIQSILIALTLIEVNTRVLMLIALANLEGNTLHITSTRN